MIGFPQHGVELIHKAGLVQHYQLLAHGMVAKMRLDLSNEEFLLAEIIVGRHGSATKSLCFGHSEKFAYRSRALVSHWVCVTTT